MHSIATMWMPAESGRHPHLQLLIGEAQTINHSGMKISLESTETVVMHSPATLDRAPVRHDGELILTNQRIHFETPDGKVDWTYWLDEIQLIRHNNLLFVWANGFVLQFVDGLTEKILTYKRDTWVATIMAMRVAFSTRSGWPAMHPHAVEFSTTTKTRMRINLEKSFSLEELRNLCYSLNVEFENLPGETREAKARELVIHCDQVGTIQQLLIFCQELRPLIRWVD